jgi:hypothetical protein
MRCGHRLTIAAGANVRRYADSCTAFLPTMNRETTNDRQRKRTPSDEPGDDSRDPGEIEHKDEGEIEHILDTGLPPGIDIEDAVDPGNSPKSPPPAKKP